MEPGPRYLPWEGCCVVALQQRNCSVGFRRLQLATNEPLAVKDTRVKTSNAMAMPTAMTVATSSLNASTNVEGQWSKTLGQVIDIARSRAESSRSCRVRSLVRAVFWCWLLFSCDIFVVDPFFGPLIVDKQGGLCRS